MGKKILLADDSITIQKVIELTFSDEDFEVVTVGNGRLAVEKLEEVRPDIVLCDIIMPEKDGYEVCDFIRKHPTLGHVPVLLLTGAFEPFDQERAARVGCDGFLAKPFEPQSLITKVKDLLNQAASRPRPIAPPPAVFPVVTASAAVPFAGPEPVLAARAADPLAETVPSAPAAFVPPEPEALVAEPEPAVADFGEPVAPPGVGTYSQPMELTPEPGTPAPPYAPVPVSEPLEDFGTEEAVVASQDELMPLMAEEAASLGAAPAAPAIPEPAVEVVDSARTVMFKAEDAPNWSQPTLEVPLETRAQATAAAAAESARPVFEPAPPTVETPAPELEVDGAFEPDFGEPAAPRPVAPEPAPAPPVVVVPPAPVAAPVIAAPPPAAERVSFGDIRPAEPEAPPPSQAAEVAVPMEQVAQIAQRVVAQISERVVREVAWEVIPDLAEAIIKKEIERLRAELEKV